MTKKGIDISFFTCSLGFSVDTQYGHESIVFDIKSRLPYSFVPDGIDISDVSIFGEPFYEGIFFRRNIVE
jgi:hypothetical protein